VNPRPVLQVVRAWPSASPAEPEPVPPWPDHALVIVHRSTRPGGGRLTYGMARLVGGRDPEPVWSFYGRGVRRSTARRFFGDEHPSPVFFEELHEEAIRRCCQRPPLRAALVSWSVPAFVSSAAWAVDARGDDYRFTLRTWKTKDGTIRPDFYRSRVRIAPSSSGVAQVRFLKPRDPDPQDFWTRSDDQQEFWPGRFASLSILAYALTGEEDVTLPRALDLYGIGVPTADGAGGLAAELDATCALYRAMLDDLALWPGNPAPDRIGSPAALGKAAARAAVPRTPRARPGVSVRGKAAAMSAHAGGRSEVGLRHEALPGVLVDGTAFYPVVGALMGTGRFLHAERVEERRLTPGRGLERLRRRLEALAFSDELLDDPLISWPDLVGVALIEPEDDVLTLRVLPDHERDPTAAVTLTAPVAEGSVPVWVALPEVVASARSTGRIPKLLRAYTWRAVGVVPGARAVTLPGGVTYDPALRVLRRGVRFSDLGLALAEAELRLRGSDDLRARRLRGALKVARSAASYGWPAEVNPSRAAHPAWTPEGKAGVIREKPGAWADPPVAACVAAGGRLALAILERLVREAGGEVVRFDTDAATIVATPKGGEVALSSGEMVHALSFAEVVAILNRFGPLVAGVGLSIPAYLLEPLEGGGFRLHPCEPPGDLWSCFKLESENLQGGDRWTPGCEVLAVAEKRYAAFRRDRGLPRAIKAMGHSIANLSNFRHEGRADWPAIIEAWDTGVLAVERGEASRDGLLRAARSLGYRDLAKAMAEPVLQPIPLSDPRQWRALGKLRFSKANPERLRPFDTVLVPAVMGHGLPWAPERVVVIPGERGSTGELLGRDTKGRTYSLVAFHRMMRGPAGPPSRNRRLAVQDVGSWLAEYFARPEPGFCTPAGDPCGPETRGRLVPTPLRVVGRIVGGSEDIRWRLSEPAKGWSLHRRQETVASDPTPCPAPGCTERVEGRRRWCERHARTSGTWRRRRSTPEVARPCACGSCGKTLRAGARSDARYVSDACRKRATRRADTANGTGERATEHEVAREKAS
jgi:hypothetical protein